MFLWVVMLLGFVWFIATVSVSVAPGGAWIMFLAMAVISGFFFYRRNIGRFKR